MTVSQSDKDPPVTAKRFMLKREFWLNLNNPAEEQLAETIDALKARRLFAPTVRDGIRLVCDLRQGRLDVLFELFPWVRAAFVESLSALQPDPRALDQRLARLEQLLQAPAGPRLPAGPGSVAARPVSDAVDDDAALLTVRRDASSNSVQNFLASMMRLQQ